MFKLTGIASLVLATFVEYQHVQLALRQDYYRIVLDQMSSLFSIGSAIADLYAVYNKLHISLNLKALFYLIFDQFCQVSFGLSVITAIWCLKSVDNNSFPFYKQDINAYRVALSAARNF